jgi:hypothetical protein
LAGKSFAVLVVCHRYWRQDLIELAENQGGRCVDGIHFAYSDDQLRSMLALTGYLGGGEYRHRCLRAHPDGQRPARAAGADAQVSRLPSQFGYSEKPARPRDETRQP